jgi:hypothetical protein
VQEKKSFSFVSSALFKKQKLNQVKLNQVSGFLVQAFCSADSATLGTSFCPPSLCLTSCAACCKKVAAQRFASRVRAAAAGACVIVWAAAATHKRQTLHSSSFERAVEFSGDGMDEGRKLKMEPISSSK